MTFLLRNLCGCTSIVDLTDLVAAFAFANLKDANLGEWANIGAVTSPPSVLNAKETLEAACEPLYEALVTAAPASAVVAGGGVAGGGGAGVKV